MSWDISVMNLPAGIRSVADLPDDFNPGSLGRREDLVARIRGFEPDVDFTDPSWGQFETAGFSVEFNMGKELSTDAFMLHVRGGDAAVPFVAGLLDCLGLRAIDCSTGEFFIPAAAANSFGAWRTFRDRVLGKR